jgi:hypothetical protein
MFGKTLQKVEIQILKKKIRACLPNMTLRPFIDLAQPRGLGPLSKTNTNTPSPKLMLKSKSKQSIH